MALLFFFCIGIYFKLSECLNDSKTYGTCLSLRASAGYYVSIPGLAVPLFYYWPFKMKWPLVNDICVVLDKKTVKVTKEKVVADKIIGAIDDCDRAPVTITKMTSKSLVIILEAYIDQKNINLVNVFFVIFIVTIVVFGSLMTLVESHLPDSIRQSFRYGKHKHTGKTNWIVSYLEIPKSWFRHFYVFAFTLSLIILYFVVDTMYRETIAPRFFLRFLDLMAGGANNRKVYIDSNTALIATILFTAQCARRFYETHFLQIFSKSSKINVSHYIVGYFHYFGSFVALLANTAGFVHSTRSTSFSLSALSSLQIVCIVSFLAAWYQQFTVNMALANLRKDPKTGAIKSEQHLMPIGDCFQLVSSPHMLFEIIMYCSLTMLMANSIMWWFISFWVVSNQVSNALLTHKWYKNTFEQYPKQRRALIPYCL